VTEEQSCSAAHTPRAAPAPQKPGRTALQGRGLRDHRAAAGLRFGTSRGGAAPGAGGLAAPTAGSPAPRLQAFRADRHRFAI